jgi:type II secretory pathway component PulM
MKTWFLRQTARDRSIVMMIVVLVVAALLYALIINPMARGLKQNREAVVKNEGIIQQMLASEAQVKAMKGGASVKQKSSDKAPYLLIDEMISKHGIKTPDRVEPIGNTGVRVNFSNVEFDKLMLALGELELYGLQISTINVSRKQAGLVGARFRVDKK